MDSRKYAVLGDIHGNLEALTAVLADAEEQGVDSYVCVGDVVGYNANPAECLEKVRGLCEVVVRGNHDHYCSHSERLEDFHPLAASVIDWTRKQLNGEQVEYLRNLPLRRNVAGFTLVHSTLDMPDKWGYVFDVLDADANFYYQTAAVCFHGHTHVPVVFEKQSRVTRHAYGQIEVTLGRKYFLNVGSVGQPRDGDPRAAYVIYDPGTRKTLLRRVVYDVAATQERIRKSGLPDKLGKRLELGK